MNKIKAFTLLGLSSLFLFTISSCNQEKEAETPDDNYRVFYEIFTGSYSDATGDGIGDLKGIQSRLDYLNNGKQTSGESLGVQGIWLTPIFSSPSYHKYDAKDYYKVDSSFGTNEDLEELANECHKRNIKLILDLAINHTALTNEWFQNFRIAHENNDTSNKYYDWYSWETDTVSGKKWSKIGSSNHYYECNFDKSMPELNYDNENVREEVLNVAKYWIDLGVDGFRFDAAMYIYYGENKKSAEFWNWYMTKLREYKEGIYAVAEVWDSSMTIKNYTPYVDCFDFLVSEPTGKISTTAKGGSIKTFTRYVSDNQKSLKASRSDAMPIFFQANHDQDRCSGWLSLDEEYKMAANLYILTPGSPFIYYGEEIKMKGSRGAEEMTDANRRLAMLWGDDDKVKDPSGATWYINGKKQNGTVLSQSEDSNSILNYYKKLIAFRNKHLEIGRGNFEPLYLSDGIGGFTITYNDKVSILLHNNQDEEKTVDISSISNYKKIDVIGVNNANISGNNLTIGAYTSVLLQA